MSDKFIWRMEDLDLIKKVKKEEKEPELEESIALALQNYRDGAIDADDLVAFLLPAKLEEQEIAKDETRT